MSEDLYEILEVPRNASADEIKRSYRKLARAHHPDANPGDEEAERRFKEIAQAYEVLGDQDRRAQYDQFGSTGARGADFGGGEGFADLFDAFFGGGSRFGGGQRGPSGPPPGNDIEIIVDVPFEDAVLGGETSFDLKLPVACDACEATGAHEDSGTESCGTCGGAGQVQQVRQSLLGQMVSTATCPTCMGMGQIIPDPCRVCRGEGRVTEPKSFSIEVPAGIDHGSRLRLSGRGAAGPRGGPRGDLYVVLRVGEHARFRREGDDLVEELWIPVTQAALGAQLEYETLDSTEVLEIPPGTVTGREFRLRDRGVPRLHRRGRGDALVRVVVETPAALDDAQEALLRELAELRGEEVAAAGAGWLKKIRSAFS